MGTMRPSDRVKLNVGGRIFETTMTTLAMSGTDSFFSALLRDRQLHREQGDEIFIDRDPKYFDILLNLLRTGNLDMPENMSKDFLYKEAQFYGLERHLKASVTHYLKGDFLRLARSIRISAAMPSPSQGLHRQALVRGSPTGGFCVANASTVRFYNGWNLEEHQPLIHLRTKSSKSSHVFDVVWQDSSNIFMSAHETIWFYDSIAGAFSHGFQEYDWPVYYQSLCLNSDRKLFSSCASVNNGWEYYVAVWDASVGKMEQSVPISENLSESSTVKKLQWLNSGIDCLLVVQCVLQEKFMLRYIDPRAGKVPHTSIPFVQDRKPYIVDATSGQDPNITYMMDGAMNLWFLDHRKFSEPWLEWNTLFPKDLHDYPESLHSYNGQLFALTAKNVFLYNGEEWVFTKVTANTDGSAGGLIRDVSFGGDRLFSLHINPDEIRVWETTPCLIESYI